MNTFCKFGICFMLGLLILLVCWSVPVPGLLYIAAFLATCAFVIAFLWTR